MYDTKQIDTHCIKDSSICHFIVLLNDENLNQIVVYHILVYLKYFEET